MKRRGIVLIGVIVAVAALVALGWWLLNGVQIDVLQPQGGIAKQQRTILTLAIILSAIVVLPVFTMLGVFAWRYRESNHKAKYRPDWNKNAKLEALWWGIPIAIICFLGTVAWLTAHSLDPYKRISSDKPVIEVQVVALQWKWLFLYPDLGIATVNQLPVEAGRPIHFTLTADAPMSAFWVPALGTQIYAMNGMSSQLNLIADQPGDYRGYATNINGTGYADMTFTVHALNKEKFSTWVKSAKASPAVMNETAYATLTKPSIVKTETTYSLQDSRLFSTIVDKYMKGTIDPNEQTTSPSKPAMNHMHDMETGQ
jgi:cytochrome o ubiquinol oxidase subunit 2